MRKTATVVLQTYIPMTSGEAVGDSDDWVIYVVDFNKRTGTSVKEWCQ